MCLCLDCGDVAGVGGEWLEGLGQGLGGCVLLIWIICVAVHSRYLYIVLDGYMHVHIRCTQCSIFLNIIDICFLTCICLWQILQI